MTESITALESEVRSLELQAQAAELRAQVALLDQSVRMVDPLQEGFGDYVDRREFLHDTPGFQRSDLRISQASDRSRGSNYPHWQTETEHAEIRGIARFIADTDEVGIGALENLTNYIIGTGFTYRATPKEGYEETAKELAAVCQKVIDQFIETNGWEGDLERELFKRLRRDGEFFARVYAREGKIEVDELEPDFITEPANPRAIEDWLGVPAYDWSYGIPSDLNRPKQRHGFFCVYFGERQDWEFYHPQEVIHAKVNVDRVVKRGLSDFYAVYQDLERCAKVVGNTLQGAAIQAAIAFIIEHAPGVGGAQITGAANAAKETTYNRAKLGGGTESTRVERFLPGTVKRIPNGHKYHPGPMGTPQGSNFIDVAQAGLRLAGIRWTMPEYMISGDASNANYASTMVSESPFVKSAESQQAFVKRKFAKIFWAVLSLANRSGALQRFGVSAAELTQLIEINITAPEIATRDEAAEDGRREIQKRNGVLSARTWAEQSDLDYDVEVQRGARTEATLGGFPAMESHRGRIERARQLLTEGYP